MDTTYLQAKWREGTVERHEIQKFAGSLQSQRARKAVFITTSSFTKEAREYVGNVEVKIILLDGADVIRLMIDHRYSRN